jgi:hypothetical protein
MTTPKGQVPEALEDHQVRKLAAIGAVSTSSGLVERRPIEYRRELEDQFVRGFRAAESRLHAQVAALTPAQPAAPQGVAYAELPYPWRDKVAELAGQIEKCGATWIEANGGTAYNVGRSDGVKFAASELRKLLAGEAEHAALRASHGQAPAGALTCRILNDADMDLMVTWMGQQERGDIGFARLAELIIHNFAAPTPQPAPATQQAGDDLAELSLLNRLIELGGKAAGAHATSNSDDGPKGTAAYVQWQELRAEMGELIRKFYAAAPQPSPTAQAAPATTDFTTLDAAMRAIQQAIGLIGEPADERMQTIKRVLRGAVIVAEDSGEMAAPAAGAVAGPTDEKRSAWQQGYAQGVASAVPSKVTPDMRRVFREGYREGGFWADRLDYALEKMLAAAPTPAAQADSVLEDAARYRWLFGARTEAQAASETETVFKPLPQDEVLSHLQGFYMSKPEVDALVDAARKQGVKHD